MSRKLSYGAPSADTTEGTRRKRVSVVYTYHIAAYVMQCLSRGISAHSRYHYAPVDSFYCAPLIAPPAALRSC